MRYQDLTGQKFGRLTAVSIAEPHRSPCGHIVTMWNCICDCGNKKVVSTVELKRGNVRSCGCLMKELVAKRSKKYNNYTDCGDYIIGFTTKGYEYYIDKEDFDKIKKYCWTTDKQGYLVTTVYEEKKKGLKMHRLIMNCPKNKYVDHINHNVADNRKSNLLIVTNSQNNMNKKILNANTSGITGVYYSKDYNKWYSIITENKKVHHLGYYKNKQEAIKARKNAEDKYFQEYSYRKSTEENKK